MTLNAIPVCIGVIIVAAILVRVFVFADRAVDSLHQYRRPKDRH